MNDPKLTKREFMKTAVVLGGVGATTSAVDAKGTDSAASAAGRAAGEVLMEPAFESASNHGFTSDVIHLGEETGFSVTPIYQAKNVRGIYQRPSLNPTVDALEVKIRSLEGGEAATSAPCGMSIITQMLLTFLSAGDRIIVHRCVYDNTMNLLESYLPRFGIDVQFVDMHDPANMRAALKPHKTNLVFFEPYVNPTCEILDAPAIIKTAKDAGALCVVDNTWLSPYLFQPLRLGADLVLHSATKYLGGHGNAMGGVISGSKDRIGKIETTIGVMGGILRPFDAFQLTQGVKTLQLRMERHTASALKVAQFLESHPRVARVRYGGLPSWDRGGIGARYLRGFGGMIGVEWKDAGAHATFGNRLKLCKPWVSLGDVVTLVSKRDPVPKRAIPERYTRISVGLEDVDDIISDFHQALA